MRIYIAGPMRGYPNFNFPAFDEAAARGRALGHEIISPAEIDREKSVKEGSAPMQFDEHGHQVGEVPKSYAGPIIDMDFMRAAAMRDCIAIIGTWSEFQQKFVGGCDAVAVLPGWENSKGANGEKGIAEWIGLEILDARTFYTLGYEPVCYTCSDGACPSMHEIAMQQARELANTPPLPSLQSALDDEGSFAADIRRVDDEDSSVEDLRRNSSEPYPLPE